MGAAMKAEAISHLEEVTLILEGFQCSRPDQSSWHGGHGRVRVRGRHPAHHGLHPQTEASARQVAEMLTQLPHFLLKGHDQLWRCGGPWHGLQPQRSLSLDASCDAPGVCQPKNVPQRGQQPHTLL